MKSLKLGLIGGNIKASKAPLLHRLAGEQNNIDVQYDLLIPQEMNMDFDEVFAHCMDTGYDGVNVTYPYKERAAKKVQFKDAFVREMGAVNTVIFKDEDVVGWNTDFSGFIKAYDNLGRQAPGDVVMLGSGGVGRAIAFALVKLGAHSISIYDLDATKSKAVADEINALGTASKALNAPPRGGYEGIVNCTPIGMNGIGGTPLPPENFGEASWVFDAIYTPLETEFLRDAKARGLQILSGFELFFYQGVDAWHHFSGLDLDEANLRDALAESEKSPSQ